LRRDLEPCLVPAVRPALERHAHGYTLRINLGLAEELIVFHLARGEDGGLERDIRIERLEFEFVAVEVVAGRYFPARFERVGVDHARRERECLVRLEQLVLDGGRGEKREQKQQGRKEAFSHGLSGLAIQAR
jgi:hypothetical protein